MRPDLRQRLLAASIVVSVIGIAAIVGTHRLHDRRPAAPVVVGDVVGREGVGQLADDVLSSTNAITAARGLGTLTVDPCLEAVAGEWETYLEASSRLVSRSSAGIDTRQALDSFCPGRWLTVGGNVGTAPSLAGLTAAFMQDDATRSNLLDPAFTHIGVAVGRRAGDARELVVVAQFGVAS